METAPRRRRRNRHADLPDVTADQVEAAVAAITARHLERDAPYADELSEDPAEMFAHLRKRSINFAADLRRLDYPDVVTLARWLAEHEARRIELWTLEQGKQLGLTNRQVGEPYGLAISRQGVPDRIKALRRRVHGSAADVERSPAVPAGQVDPELEWLAANRARVHGLARELLTYEPLADDDAADWLADVRRDLDDGACTPASFSTIKLAVAELTSVPEVMALDAGHALWTLVREWRALVAGHDAVSGGTPGTGTAPAA
jgi:hypothetical protein